MNPLTLVKRIQNINSREAALGISEEASWHAKYKESAYVFVGGIPFDLTEGDLLAVFAQYGEIVDVNLVRDKGTGKSKGFAFVAYEDQRSTNLAVDNLNGAQILGRIIRVDHVSNYKSWEEEDEETKQKKRENRGVCYAFQRGECNRGAGCKFSHDEQRAANTGWGAEDNKGSRWRHDRLEDQTKSDRRYGIGDKSSDRDVGRADYDSARSSKAEDNDKGVQSHRKQSSSYRIDQDIRGLERRSEQKEKGGNQNEVRDRDASRDGKKRSTRHESGPNSSDDDRRGKRRSSRHESDSYQREDRDTRGGERQPTSGRDYSSHRHRERER